jgi:hypothetical protein
MCIVKVQGMAEEVHSTTVEGRVMPHPELRGWEPPATHLAAEEVVEGAVLHEQHDEVVDLVLVRRRRAACLRARAPWSIAAATRDPVLIVCVSQPTARHEWGD